MFHSFKHLSLNMNCKSKPWTKGKQLTWGRGLGKVNVFFFVRTSYGDL